MANRELQGKKKCGGERKWASPGGRAQLNLGDIFHTSFGPNSFTMNGAFLGQKNWPSGPSFLVVTAAFDPAFLRHLSSSHQCFRPGIMHGFPVS